MRITGRQLRQIIKEEITRANLKEYRVSEDPRIQNFDPPQSEDIEGLYTGIMADLRDASVPGRYEFDSALGASDNGYIIVMMTYYNRANPRMRSREAEEKMKQIAESFGRSMSDFEIYDIPAADVLKRYDAHKGYLKNLHMTGAERGGDFFTGKGSHYIALETDTLARGPGLVGQAKQGLGLD